MFDDSDADQNNERFYKEVCSNNGPDCIEASNDSFGNLLIIYKHVHKMYLNNIIRKQLIFPI